MAAAVLCLADADSHLFKYVVEEMYHEARNQGCSWVAAPAPRALPLLGAVAVRGGFPACYIHKAGELPGAVVSVKEGPYQLELPADLSLKGPCVTRNSNSTYHPSCFV